MTVQGPVVVEADGPRRIIRSIKLGRWFYVSFCNDCDRTKAHSYRRDAQDWIDHHRCEEGD